MKINKELFNDFQKVLLQYSKCAECGNDMNTDRNYLRIFCCPECAYKFNPEHDDLEWYVNETS